MTHDENGGEELTNAEDFIPVVNPGENLVQQLIEMCACKEKKTNLFFFPPMCRLSYGHDHNPVFLYFFFNVFQPLEIQQLFDELSEKANSKYKLYRKKIEALCLSCNINIQTKPKCSSNINNLQYINKLIMKLHWENGGQHVISNANIHSSIPNINPAYESACSEKDHQHATFI
jgi:hypothetical protein